MRVLIFISTFLLLSGTGYAQIKFFKLFTNNGVDMGQGAVQLEDSSYVITGTSSSFQAGPAQAFLLHIDSLGNYLWSTHYGGSEIEGGRRVLYKKNFGYFICGYTNSMGAGGFDMYIAKIKENAELEWEKTVGGTGWEQVHDASLTRDTGIFMVGETSSNATDNKDIYIVRTDKFGDTLWTKTLGGPGDDYATSLRRHNDSLFIIGGRKWIEDSLMHKGFMMYMKDDGTIFWYDTMGVNGNYWINDVIVDGSRFVGVGGTESPAKQGLNLYFYPVDLNGIPLGPYEENAAGDEDLAAITSYGGTNKFYVGAERDDAGSYEGGVDLLIHTFLNNFVWVSGFGVAHIDPDVVGQMLPTSDGGALVVGYTTGVVSGGNEIFVLKIGPDGNNPNTDLDVIIDDILIVEGTPLPDDVHIYPNPANDHLQIEVPAGSYNQARIMDGAGKVLRSESLSLMQSLNVSDLPNGLYFLELSGDQGLPLRQKFMVIH